MSEDLWLAEHERISEEYAAGIMGRDEAVARLRSLGFSADEIDEQLDLLDGESE